MLKPFGYMGFTLQACFPLVFDGELMELHELKALIVSRVEYAMTTWANILQASIRQRNRKILKKIVRLWTVTIPKASFEKTVKGFWRCKIQL
jgi:hypothetical protein